jgi:hypothetical protein
MGALGRVKAREHATTGQRYPSMYGFIWFCLCLGMYRYCWRWAWVPATVAAFGTALAALMLGVWLLEVCGWG